MGRLDCKIPHSLTEYRREVTVSAAAFRPINESSGDPIHLRYSTPISIPSPSNILFLTKRLATHWRLLGCEWPMAALITYALVAWKHIPRSSVVLQ
ncbi:hypothetical protein EVAR_51101_1 [Eumeta japonica]|uniref:Uncharacterized protein n=1 Tax=Eumeta variegata TaxID=151549 RepID=A0A4C1XJZ8_EUMVA|nr:hypothetical protein EVAR_51101_1 [Eumeta japonica]